MNRLHHIDIAKGMLILCLLIAHFGIALKVNGVGTQYFAPILYWQPVFSTFFMQCFFLITGYCSNLDLSSKAYFEKLLKQLVVPYIFFGFANGVTGCLLMPDHFHSIFTSLWFLNALIFSKTIVWGLKQTIKNDRYIVLATLLFLILGVLLNDYNIGEDYLDIRKGLVATFFVALGHMLRDKPSLVNLLRKGWFIYPLAILVVYILHHQWDLPSEDGKFDVTLVQIPLFLALTILGSITTLTLARWIKECAFIEFFGRNSIIVYCLHFPYLCVISGQLLTRIAPTNYLAG